MQLNKRLYYYEIYFQPFRYSPTNSRIVKSESISDAKLHGYAILNAYNVSYVIRINKP